MIDLLWFICALLAATLLLDVCARILCVRQTSSWFGPGPWLPNRWREPADDGEFVEFAAFDGTKLRGSYLVNTDWRRKGAVIFCHELNGDRWNCLPYVEDLRRRGFDVLSFDFRNQGSSSRAAGYDPTPWATTFEAADLAGALDFLYARDDLQSSGVGVIGVCRRGRGARHRGRRPEDSRPGARQRRPNRMHASPQGARSSNGCSDRSRRPARLLRRPAALFDSWFRIVLGHWRKCRFVDVDRVSRLIDRPVMVVHGENDQLVPLDVARALVEAMPGDASLWAVPGSGHGMAVDVAGDEYRRRLGDFFERHLAADFRADGPVEAAPKPLGEPAPKPDPQVAAARVAAR